ncbi:T9SS type A sorting domain-containing protein [Hymenobacter sp. BT523]|uniref:T9SS type A sorting domain-containing protein n=1 Tax=Hymenobacter sp. BT523 TaxID=2795725 RepID=UPI0018EB2F33|nr:T9SS type A sorting domain-containing protein [Hymenobacter sp. BT523]MBJ6109065.1 T9SS type A sorting domain-containing protein [Hymenobacter sp. BT523]
MLISWRPAAQAQLYPAPDCSQPQTYTATLGDPTQVTVYSSNTTFGPGDYHVVGDLYFRNCTVDIQPGAYFHVDGKSAALPRKPLQVTGYSIILGDKVTVTATGAQFNASCKTNMWKGLTFDPAGTAQVLTLTNCTVGNANFGLNVPSGCTDATYYLDRCDFRQNLYHVVDYSYHSTAAVGSIPCFIKDSQFLSQPSLLPPYAPAKLDSWTTEALHLTPTGNNDGRAKIRLIGNNTIDGCLYGLVANRVGQGTIEADNGTLQINRAVRVGVWLDVMTDAINRLPLNVNIGMNNLIAGRTYQALYTSPGEQQYGLVAAATKDLDWNFNLTVAGAPGDTSSIRCQTGVLLDEVNTDLKRMNLSTLSYGLSLRSGTSLVSGNTFNGNLHGLRIRPNSAAYTTGFDVSCNSFIASGEPSSSGIYIDRLASLNDQGSLDYPVGNLFTSYGTGLQAGSRSIVNDGPNNNFTYYRFSNSTDEEITSIKTSSTGSTLPQSNGSVISTFPNRNSNAQLVDYCKNLRNVNTGAQMRSGSRAAFMQALMDTLRRQAAPTVRLGRYQGVIRQWLLLQEPDTAALDAYVRSLPLTNPGAFLGLGLDLLEQYRRTGKPVAAASLRRVLAGPAALQPAASARLALSDVLSRMRPTSVPLLNLRPLTTNDSTSLHRLARTPGGTAEMAALWFNYLYPRERPATAGLRPSETSGSSVQYTSEVAVRALYPSPATDQLHAEVSGPANKVELQLYSLVSGKLMTQAELQSTGQGIWRADVKVRGVPAGQYAARLLVDGVPVSMQKVVVNR